MYDVSSDVAEIHLHMIPINGKVQMVHVLQWKDWEHGIQIVKSLRQQHTNVLVEKDRETIAECFRIWLV